MEMKCLIIECNRNSSARGLCNSCYISALNMIRTGKITNEELIKKGMVLEARKKQSSFVKQFNTKNE